MLFCRYYFLSRESIVNKRPKSLHFFKVSAAGTSLPNLFSACLSPPQGHRYVVHHMNYKNLGYERLGRDVVPLSPFAHNFVIHGILAGFKSAGKQGKYPNLLQRTVHFWCNQRLWFKLLLLFSVLFAFAYPNL